MSTLLLRFAGPLQAWGTSSRFAYRFTDTEPSKSAVIGLLASAQGRRRTDDIEDLLGLTFGVRVDQPGSVVRDFQTARALDASYTLPLSYRYYLGDAVFVVAVAGDDGLIGGLADAVRRPAYPLFLGRRSCPPARSLVMGIRAGGALEALRSIGGPDGVDWQASSWYRRKQPQVVQIDLVRDAESGERGGETVSDVPVSFDPEHRRYRSRSVVRERLELDNPAGRAEWSATGPGGAPRGATSHDAWELLEGQT